MNVLTTWLTNTNRPRRRLRSREGMLLALLAVLAVYRGTLALRSAPSLQSASLQALQDVTRREPYNRRAFYLLGLRWQQVGDTARASAALERAATLDTDDEAVWLAWASQQSGAYQDTEAIRILKSFLTLHPNSAQAHLALVRIYHRQQAYRLACAEAEATVRLQARLVEPWRLIGADAESLKELPKAENALRQALACDPTDAVNAFDLGRFLMRHDRVQEAVPYFRAAFALAPNQPAISLVLGQALLKTAGTDAEIEAARGILTHSAAQRPNHPQTCLAISDSYRMQHRWREALAALKPLESVPPDGLENQLGCAYQRAQIYGRLGNAAAALRERARHDRLLQIQSQKAMVFDRIQQHPPDPEPRLKLARLCVQYGDYEEAEAVYRKLLEYAPQSQQAQGELVALESAHPTVARPFTAAQESKAAFTTDTPLPVLLADGDWLYAQRKYQEAKAAYLQALARDRKSARACQGLGIVLEAQGDLENAFAYLQQALALDPHLVLAERTLARLYMQAGFPNEAKRRLLHVVQDAPQDAAGWYDLGLVYRASGSETGRAEETFRRAVTLMPDSPVYLLEWADTLAERSQPGKAEDAYRHALAAAPENAAALSRLGAFLLDSRPTDAGLREAAPLLQRADKIEPNNAFTLYNLGRLAVLRHADRQAIGYLEASLQQRPDMVSGWYALAQARRRTGQASAASAALTQSRRLQEAFAEYTRVVGLAATSPEQPKLRLLLARQYALRGENAHAINQYQVCLRLDPKNQSAQQELSELTSRLKAQGKLPAMSLYNAMVNSFTNKNMDHNGNKNRPVFSQTQASVPVSGPISRQENSNNER